MPSGGHNRKSASQARMEGTYRADRHVEPVKLAPGEVEPPVELGVAALELWDRYVQPRLDTGVYEPAEAPMLAHWCNTLARLIAANRVTPFEGLYEVEDDYGRVQFVKHPGMSVWKALAEEFRAVSARLGMDPLARMQLADLQSERDGVGPSLPNDAPPAWTPQVVAASKGRVLKPRCSSHARRWRKSCDECQRVRRREGLA